MASSHLIPLRDPYFKPQFGDWISAPKCDEVIEFCRDIDLSSSPTKVLITIGSLGFFQARINGERISSSYYEGLFSDYEARDPKKEPSLVLGQAHGVYLSCYDVTRFFKNGRNTLTVLLGNGYYQNEERFAEPFYASFGTKKLYFLLRLVYANGSEEMIESDSQTLVRKTAILSGLYRGNRIDFSAPKAPFQHPEIVKAAKASYRFAPIFSDQLCQVITPKLFYSTRGVLRYDCGVNHAGGVALQIQGRKGQEIEIRHAEVLYPDGTLNLETSRYEERDAQGQLLDRIDQISHYTLSGGIDTIEPLFNWYCYRYFEIVGAEGATITHLASYDIHMPLENSGHFSSSEPFLDEIEIKTRRTFLDNFHAGILSDCPHREKRPYTGDGSVAMDSAFYLFDAEGFYRKWYDDILLSQREDGFVPYTAPHLGGGGGYPWSMAIVEVAVKLYQYTGDRSLVEKAYEPCLRWLDFLNHHAKDHIVESNGQLWLLGDWLTPEMTVFNVSFMSTLCLDRTLQVLIQFAQILGAKEEADLRQELAEVQAAINQTFFNPKTLSYCTDEQGEDVLPLALGVVEERYREPLKAKIAGIYKDNGFHLDTGIVTTPYLFDALFENGLGDIALKILLNPTYPSYHAMLENETTLSEHWSKKWIAYKVGERIIPGGGELSHCHPMFGSVVASLFRHVGGLDLSHLGEKTIRFAPKVIGLMKQAEASKELPSGKASIRWSAENELKLSLIIPEGYHGILDFASLYHRYSLEGKSEEIRSKDGVCYLELPAGVYHLKGYKE